MRKHDPFVNSTRETGQAQWETRMVNGHGALQDEHSLPRIIIIIIMIIIIIRIHFELSGHRLGLDTNRSSRPMERVSFSLLQHAHRHGRVSSLMAPCSYHRNLPSSPTMHHLMQAMNEAPLDLNSSVQRVGSRIADYSVRSPRSVRVRLIDGRAHETLC